MQSVEIIARDDSHKRIPTRIKEMFTKLSVRSHMKSRLEMVALTKKRKKRLSKMARLIFGKDRHN